MDGFVRLRVYVRSLPRAVEVRSAVPPAVAPTKSASPSPLIVHVAGEVRRPGVYEFHEESRPLLDLDDARTLLDHDLRPTDVVVRDITKG